MLLSLSSNLRYFFQTLLEDVLWLTDCIGVKDSFFQYFNLFLHSSHLNIVLFGLSALINSHVAKRLNRLLNQLLDQGQIAVPVKLLAIV